MENVFISVVGTQALATLNPLLVMREVARPQKIFLLQTSRTQAVAARVADYAKANGLADCELLLVNNEIGLPDSADTVAAQLASEAKARGQRVVFNVNGGLNFLVSACVLALLPYDPLLLNASSKITLFYEAVDDWRPKAGKMPLELPIRAVLDLQDIKYGPASQQSQFMQRLDAMGVKLPENHLLDVAINDYNFDLVWNVGNNVCAFLAWIPDPGGKGGSALIPARRLAHWAATRDESGDLYDRNVYAVTNTARYKEHLKQESANKLKVAKVGREGDKWVKGRQALEKWFRYSPSKNESSVPKAPPKITLDPLDDGTLVVCLGNSPDATLVAIASHKPERLVLCYQQSQPEILQMAKNLAKLKDRLGIKKIDHVNFGAEGAYADRLLPGAIPGARVNVNITPGSKAQTALLTVWAKKEGHTIWSLHGRDKACVPLCNPHNLEPIPMAAVDPIIDLMVMNKSFLGNAQDAKDLKKNAMFPELLAFLRDLAASGRGSDLLKKPISQGGRTLDAYDANKETIRFSWPGGKRVIRWSKGLWFEQLAGLAFHEAGCEHSITRVRVAWPKKQAPNYDDKPFKAQLQSLGMIRDPANDFLQDLDVLAVMDRNKYVISCKAHHRSKGNITRAEALEAKITAQNLHRFALPVLASLTCQGHREIDGVLVLGWRELCQPQILRKLMEDFAKSKRTTAKSKQTTKENK